MRVRIQTIGDTPMPEYQTSGAVAFDLQAREETTIPARSLGLIPTGLIIETPREHALLVCARSSTPKKKGLLIPHGIGIIDQDYCGEQDEIQLQYYNFTDEDVLIKKHERCGQAMFLRVDKADFEKIHLTQTTFSETSRGGFGSTGN
ncbi:MAG: dUTP diphosphatase [Candidatus Woesearchaeota archaeon]